MKIDFKEFVSYDESSPTFLRWEVDIYSGRNYKILEVSKGDIAGSLVSSSGYSQVKIKHKLNLCHRIIWELHNGEIPEGMFIDHLDGDRLNNNINNLRLTTRQGNARNCVKRKDNTSGVTGVNLLVNTNRSGSTTKYWCGCYFENGKYFSRRFSISKLGEDEALRLAIEFRLSKEKELNKVGVPFTERHGK